MSPPARRASLVAVSAMALGLAAVAHVHAHVAWVGRLNTTELPPPPAAAAGPLEPARARRVVVLVVDGLGHDHTAGLPSLAALAARGAQRPLMAEFPSFTWPSITTMATGVPPRHSGVRLNGPGPFAVWDSVSRQAALAGIPVLVHDGGFAPFAALLQLPTAVRAVSLDELLAPGRGRELAWSYLGDVDRAGHLRGGQSPEYRAAALAADAVVGRVAAALDLERDALVVVSDHGHLDRGGHGGVEPTVLRGLLVAAGAGIGRGALPPAAQRDLAPTLAALLGTAPPASSMGSPLLDLLGEGPPRDDAMARAEIAAAERAFTKTALPRVGVGVALALLLLAAMARWSSRAGRRPRVRDLLPVAIMAGALLGAGAALGYGFSWSLPRGDWGFNLEAAGAGVAGAALAVWAAHRARAVEETAVTVAVLAVPYLLLACWVGLDTSLLPGPRSSFLLLALAQLQFYAGAALGGRALWLAWRG